MTSATQTTYPFYGMNGTANGDTINLDGVTSHVIDGAGGTDTVIYPNISGIHSLYANGNSILAQTVGGPIFQADLMSNVERVKFIDKTIAFDVDATHSAGQAALFMNAIFGKDSLAANPSLLGAVVSLFDAGESKQAFSALLFQTNIIGVATLKPNATSADIATMVLTNATGMAPDAAALAAAIDQIDHGIKGDWLNSVVYSAAAQQNVDLVGLSHTGLAYI